MGGSFVINEAQAQKIADNYFNGQNIVELQIAGKLSPKILVVEPQNVYHGNITFAEQKFGEYLPE
jgi:hypothetical protein